MIAPSTYRILLIAYEADQETRLRRYAEALAQAREAVVWILNAPPETWLEKARALRQSQTFDILVTGWYRDVNKMRTLAQISEELNLEAVIVKDWSCEPIERLLVSTSGGAHALATIRVANELAKAWNKPAHVLRVVRGHEDLMRNRPLFRKFLQQIRGLTQMQMNLMAVKMPLVLRSNRDVVGEIVRRTRPGDLIVLGGPKDWRIEQFLIGSIPAEIAYKTERPVVMVIGKHKAELSLREIFWEQTVRMDMAPHDKWEAMRTLLDALIQENQLPPHLRGQVLESAFARERQMPTAAGHETAVPHAAISNFKGLVGALGICPQGVQFDDQSSRPVRFIFFMLTPRERYNEYLSILSKIAHLMHSDAARERLIHCQTPAEVIAALG